MIRDTYAEVILEKILKEILEDGDLPTAAEVVERFEDFEEVNDISKPLFTAEDYSVETSEPSSASKFNNTNTAIYQDLKVLYKHLFLISGQALDNFDRWRSEAALVERQLNELEDRLASLLLLSTDTAGYFNYVQDNFVDMSKVDLPNTTANVDTYQRIVSIGASNSGATRIPLPPLQDKDIYFTILSRNNLVSNTPAEGSKLSYVVSDINNYWQQRIITDKPTPISIELKIDLLDTYSISRIDVDLHMSNVSSSVQVTPMYSTDDHNYSQLPVSNFSVSVMDKHSFKFEPVEARYVKFIMTKQGYDLKHNNGHYTYEFGVDEIAFFNEGFTEDNIVSLITKPLSVVGEDGNPEEFSRVALEVCEYVPEGTTINYSLFVSNASDATFTTSSFVGIDPLTRLNATKPTVLDFGDLDEIEVSGVLISYNPTETDTLFINPARNFSVITSTTGTVATVASGLASSQRYSFKNSNDRILSHSIASGINIAQGTLEIWRNICLRGTAIKVRDYATGWGFQDPYYNTTIYVDNPNGYSVDFGGSPAIIDGSPLTGRVTIAEGAHSVSIHRDNWKLISPAGATSLSILKDADSLYPYNHRYIIEGYTYSSNYPDTDEKIYRGFDIVAQYKMKQISPFELINSIPADDYNKFALDRDATDSSRLVDGSAGAGTDLDGNNIILVKVDESNPDFTDEMFLLKFKAANTQYKYIRLKADLKTTDTSIAPQLGSYRIKISS